jgi:hypothetical protein
MGEPMIARSTAYKLWQWTFYSCLLMFTDVSAHCDLLHGIARCTVHPGSRVIEAGSLTQRIAEQVVCAVCGKHRAPLVCVINNNLQV